jgi:hypothetical protein
MKKTLTFKHAIFVSIDSSWLYGSERSQDHFDFGLAILVTSKMRGRFGSLFRIHGRFT